MSELLRKAYGYIFDRKRSYELTFQINQPANVAVLRDLAIFCRANESTFHPDPRVAANLDGRREVWLRISNHLGLTADQLLAIYSGNNAGIVNGER